MNLTQKIQNLSAKTKGYAKLIGGAAVLLSLTYLVSRDRMSYIWVYQGEVDGYSVKIEKKKNVFDWKLIKEETQTDITLSTEGKGRIRYPCFIFGIDYGNDKFVDDMWFRLAENDTLGTIGPFQRYYHAMSYPLWNKYWDSVHDTDVNKAMSLLEKAITDIMNKEHLVKKMVQ